MSDAAPRWLDRDGVASYIGKRVDYIPRLQRTGKLPAPSYHFGPRDPRWDRLAIDALFEEAPRSRNLSEAERDAVTRLAERSRARRQAKVGGRDNQGVPLWSQATKGTMGGR